MAKILKNNTASDVFLSDTGNTVPALGQFTIPPFDYQLYAESDDVVVLIGNNTLTVNDGNKDLTASQGTNLIQGNFFTSSITGGIGGYNLYDPAYLKVELSNTVLELPRSTESYLNIYNYSGIGALSGASLMFNSDSVVVRLEIDGNQLFELDCSILDDMAPNGDDASTNGKFSWIDWDKEKNILKFYPRYDISFANNIKIQAKANADSNKRELDAYLIDIIKES